MLLAMLGTWAVEGTPIYASMETGQTIAYVLRPRIPYDHRQ
jgi:hypothetical protein